MKALVLLNLIVLSLASLTAFGENRNLRKLDDNLVLKKIVSGNKTPYEINSSYSKDSNNETDDSTDNISGSNDVEDGSSDSSSEGNSDVDIAEIRNDLIASGAIKETSIPSRSMFNACRSYKNSDNCGFEWVGTAEAGHIEITTASGSVIAYTPPSSYYSYSWGDRYWDKNGASANFHDSGSTDFWVGQDAYYFTSQYTPCPQFSDLPQALQDNIVIMLEK